MTGIRAHDSRRTPLTGSAFVRLLAALDDAPAPASKEAFAQRLSRWFDWTDAIPLSSALDTPAGPAGVARPGVAATANALEREFVRVRAGLGKLAAQASTADARDGFAPYRERYVAWQQSADANLGPLRRRVRSALADLSPAMARLAAVDTVMEQVVGAQERALLSTAPRWLERYFERHAQADVPAQAPGDSSARQPAGPWLDGFRQTLQDLQLAELELRLQPVEGLLAALRKSSTDRHE